MDNDSLLSTFLIIAIISVTIIDIIIIYTFIHDMCCKRRSKAQDETIRSLQNPLITTSINDDNYYTSL